MDQTKARLLIEIAQAKKIFFKSGRIITTLEPGPPPIKNLKVPIKISPTTVNFSDGWEMPTRVLHGGEYNSRRFNQKETTMQSKFLLNTTISIPTDLINNSIDRLRAINLKIELENNGLIVNRFDGASITYLDIIGYITQHGKEYS